MGKNTRNSRLEQGRKLKPEINSQELQTIKTKEKYAPVRLSKERVHESRRKDDLQQKIIRKTES
jgi:wobble nucleotide-excising tRNase